MKKQPKLMTLPRMRNILEPHADEISRQLYIDDHLAIIRGSEALFQLLAHQQPPFTFDDYRLGIIMKGSARVNLNLIEKSLSAGMLTFTGPGTIIQPVSFSPDFSICGIGIPADFPLPGPLPQAFGGQQRDFQVPTTESERAMALQIHDTLWQLVHHPPYHLPTASSLVAAQMHHYDEVFRRYASQQHVLTREQTVFDRFIQLVNLHAHREHHIAFYADRMCLTEHYLGTLVRQASGVTAKEWIDRAIIIRIKAELRHTNKTVVQISEEMNFPNPSFFNKYFKRLTQTTPAQFRG